MEGKLPQERTGNPLKFIEIPASANQPGRCIDGRNADDSLEGPQMLGGSVHPVLIRTIATGEDFDRNTLRQGLQSLSDKGYQLGVHRGSHKNPEQGKCDCGLCDQLQTILSTAVDKKDEITRRLQAIDINPQLLDEAFRKISSFALDKVRITGEDIIQVAKDTRATVEEVQGDHKEETAFVNLKQNSTFDTRGANTQERQAFNLDLWAVLEQIEALGIDRDFAFVSSLILYQATEIVLVENKGKPALPVEIHQ